MNGKLNHKGTKQLETERLILRKFKIDDYAKMYDNWASEDAVTKYLTWKSHENQDVTKSVLTDWVDNYANNDFYNWAIELKEEDKLIGNISVVNYREETMSAVLGYCMGSKWWGKEIMPEAAKAVLKYLFEEVGFNRIAADHDKNNPKSGRVMQKIGMTYEGTLRSAGFCNQGIIDEVWYSILKSEWDLTAHQRAADGIT
ncbi:MAG: GNAT family N-acetyltransferase [Treponema sp.]